MARKSISKTSAYFQKMEFGGRAKKNKAKTGSEFVPNITDNRGDFIDLGNNLSYLVGPKHKNGGINIGSDLNAEGGTRKEEIKARLGLRLTKKEKKKFGEVVENDKLDGSTKVYSAQPIMPNGMSPAEFVVRGGNKDYAFNYQENYKRVLGINDDGTRAEFGTQKPARRGYTAAQRKQILSKEDKPVAASNRSVVPAPLQLLGQMYSSLEKATSTGNVKLPDGTVVSPNTGIVPLPGRGPINVANKVNKFVKTTKQTKNAINLQRGINSTKAQRGVNKAPSVTERVKKAVEAGKAVRNKILNQGIGPIKRNIDESISKLQNEWKWLGSETGKVKGNFDIRRAPVNKVIESRIQAEEKIANVQKEAAERLAASRAKIANEKAAREAAAAEREAKLAEKQKLAAEKAKIKQDKLDRKRELNSRKEAVKAERNAANETIRGIREATEKAIREERAAAGLNPTFGERFSKNYHDVSNFIKENKGLSGGVVGGAISLPFMGNYIYDKIFNTDTNNNYKKENAETITSKPVTKPKVNIESNVNKEPEEETQLTITPKDTIISKTQSSSINKPVEIKTPTVVTETPVNKPKKEKIKTGNTKVNDAQINNIIDFNANLNRFKEQTKKFGGRAKATLGGDYEDYDYRKYIKKDNSYFNFSTPNVTENINNEKSSINIPNIPIRILQNTKDIKQLPLSDSNLTHIKPGPIPLILDSDKPGIHMDPNDKIYTVPEPLQVKYEIKAPDNINTPEGSKNIKPLNLPYRTNNVGNSIITKGDWLEAGANTLLNFGELASNLKFNTKQRDEIKGRKFISAPLIKLNNTVGINSQLHNLNQRMLASQNAMMHNTASSNVSLNRFNALTNAANKNMIELYNDKYNKENENINKQILTNAGITQGNVNAYNSFLSKQSDDLNRNYAERAKAISDAFNAQSSIFGNFENRYENRMKSIVDFNAALAKASPDVRKAILSNIHPKLRRILGYQYVF